MKLKVIITPAAEADVAESFAYIHAHSPHHARRWLRALYREIRALEEFAGYGRAPESDYLEIELRQKIFKSHRIIYTLD
jgi:plasmid stabilization system protein ParE